MPKRLKAFSINKAHPQVLSLRHGPIRMQVRESRWAGGFGLLPRGTPCEEEAGPPTPGMGRRIFLSLCTVIEKAGRETFESNRRNALLRVDTFAIGRRTSLTGRGRAVCRP